MPCGLCTSGWYGIKREGESAMSEIRLSDSEYRLIAAVWEDEPVNSTELVRRCEKKYGWKKSTTYTILKKLEQKGAVCNQNAMVASLVNRQQVMEQEGKELLHRMGGSLPDFFAAFLKDRKLTKEEAQRIYRMIQDVEE